MAKLTARAAILNIAPYVQGKRTLNGVAKSIKLSSNESSHGPSPAAVAAYHAAAADLNRYPDGGQWGLRAAIAETYDLDADKIVCGNGSEELIGLLVRAYVGNGDHVLLSQNGFIMSKTYCATQGARLNIATEKNYRIDVDAMLALANDDTRFCTIANPNNPTGTYINSSELRRLHAGLPESCLFLVDNAYAEYVIADDYDDAIGLVNEYDNVVTTRTFSKIYGLSALRIGWAYCPQEIIDVIQRIRTPFNTNSAALAAATAAVRDTEYIKTVCEHNTKSLQHISQTLRGLGIEVIPSVANFYLLKFNEDTGRNGSDATAFLQSRGIIPRPANDSDQFLRITVGLDEENDAVLAALSDYMKS